MEIIDGIMAKLLQMSDDDLVEKAKMHLQAEISNTPSGTVKTICENHQKGDSLASESKGHLAMFVAFEELAGKNQT